MQQGAPSPCRVPTLTSFATAALAEVLLNASIDLDAKISVVQRIPEPELARDVWECCLRRRIDADLQEASGNAAPVLPPGVHEVFAASFWQPAGLAIVRPGAAWVLTWAGRRLRHLELCDHRLANLHWMGGLRELVCLSLRGCVALPAAALASLAPLQHLRSLDLAGMSALRDADLAVAVAGLPQLTALNLGYTLAGDATLAAITYAHRAADWAREYGQLLPEQQRGWRRSGLRQLRLEHSAVGAAGAAHLLALPALDFLDLRGTAALQHGVLQKLGRRFGLQTIQGGVLAASASLAAAAVNSHAVTCMCGSPPPGGGVGDWRDGWAARGIAEMAEAESVTVGTAVWLRGSGDDRIAASTPFVAPGFRRPRPPRSGERY